MPATGTPLGQSAALCPCSLQVRHRRTRGSVHSADLCPSFLQKVSTLMSDEGGGDAYWQLWHTMAGLLGQSLAKCPAIAVSDGNDCRGRAGLTLLTPTTGDKVHIWRFCAVVLLMAFLSAVAAFHGLAVALARFLAIAGAMPIFSAIDTVDLWCVVKLWSIFLTILANVTIPCPIGLARGRSSRTKEVTHLCR